jgi:multiple sugar transport system permease protein
MPRLTPRDAALFLAPAFLVMLVITLYPFLYTLVLSFHDWNLAAFHGKKFVGLANYVEFFTNPDVWHALRVTAVYVVSCVTIELVLGIAIAFLFDTAFRGAELARNLLLLPMVMSSVVVGLIWRWIFNAELGVLNYFVEAAGFAPPSWLTQPSLALISVVVADVWQWTPLVFLVCLAGLKAVPPDTIESAALDGASWWQIQRHVALPAIQPIILTVVLIRTIDCLRFVDKIFVMTYGGPAGATSTLGFQIYLKGFKYFQMGATAAYSIVYMAIIIILAKLLIRTFSRADARAGDGVAP